MFLIPHFKYNQGALSEESDTFRIPLCLFVHLFFHTRDVSEKLLCEGEQPNANKITRSVDRKKALLKVHIDIINKNLIKVLCAS